MKTTYDYESRVSLGSCWSLIPSIHLVWHRMFLIIHPEQSRDVALPLQLSRSCSSNRSVLWFMNLFITRVGSDDGPLKVSLFHSIVFFIKFSPFSPPPRCVGEMVNYRYQVTWTHVILLGGGGEPGGPAGLNLFSLVDCLQWRQPMQYCLLLLVWHRKETKEEKKGEGSGGTRLRGEDWDDFIWCECNGAFPLFRWTLDI